MSAAPPLLAFHLIPAGSATPQSIVDAVQKSVALGANALSIRVGWAELEPAPGRIELPPPEELTGRALRSAFGLRPYYHVTGPLDIHRRDVPADLQAAALDGPEMIERFAAFVEAFLERCAPLPERFHLALGNEVNTVLRLRPAEVEPFRRLLAATADRVRRRHPGALIGTTIAFQPPFPDGPLIDALRPDLDWIGLQWYAFARNPVGERSYRPGAGLVAQTLDLMEVVAGRLPILLTEIGMPTSAVLDGTEELQAQFVRELLPAVWARRDRFQLLCWWYLHDLSPELMATIEPFFESLPAGLGTDPGFREYFRSVGIYNCDGSPKAAAAAWKETMSATQAPVQAAPLTVTLELSQPGEPFPPLHRGRYEVDPVATGISPPPPRLAQAVRECGIDLVRVGVGVWLPGHEPANPDTPDREWFRGTTLADAQDPSRYHWEHLDGVLDSLLALGADALLSIDYMPATLADEKSALDIPKAFLDLAPGYTFPNGRRNAPPRDPEVFAAACVKLLEHITGRGVKVRYAELWNEPDLPFWWWGSFDEWWSMYRAFALAAAGAGYRVGGTSFAGLQPELWRDEFIRRCAAEQVPLDFFTWHAYERDPAAIFERARAVQAALDGAGLKQTASVIDEWGYVLEDHAFWGTAGYAAHLAQSLIGLAALGVEAQAGGLLIDPIAAGPFRILGLVHHDGTANPSYHCLRAFEELQETPRQVPVAGAGFAEAVAGVDLAGARGLVIVPNLAAAARPLELRLDAGSASGSVSHLTQASFEDGRWTDPAPLPLSSAPARIELPPGSLTLIRLEGISRG